jgi:hypothetical protein
MGAAEILVGGGVAALLAALVGGGSKAFGIELPVLASVRRQGLLAIAGVALVSLGLLSGGRAGNGTMAYSDNASETMPGGEQKTQAAPPPQASPPVRQRPDVPNIVGLPYSAARQFLMQNSWAPVNVSSSVMANGDLGLRAQEIGDAGYSDAVSCSSTSFAPCLFRYQSPGGYILEVSTAGEDIVQAKVNGAVVVDCSAVPKPDACWAGSGSGS